MDRALPSEVRSGVRARLIPPIADTSKEGRALSVVLACMEAVPDFARELLESLGQRSGKRTSFEAWTEVVPSNLDGKRDRPDGLILSKTGSRSWSALIEAKVGNASLNADQISRYLALAKSNRIDAVITVSNDYVAAPTHHPVKISRNQLRTTDLFHWSWQHILTTAKIIIDIERILDSDQRYILQQMILYLEHPSSGVRRFDRMNSEWRDLVKGLQTGVKFNRTAPEIQNSVGAWHQEERDLALQLAEQLSRPVEIKMSRAHRANAEKRLKDVSDQLVKSGQLHSTLEVPDLAAPIEIVVDLAKRLATCSMRLSAPQDRKSTKARVNWLVRQLAKTPEEDVIVRGHWPYRTLPTQETLAVLRVDPATLSQDSVASPVSSFEVSMVRDMAGRFSGAKTFVEELEKLVPEFYDAVAEHLTAWRPSPPKIKKRPGDEEQQQLADSSEGEDQVSSISEAETKTPEIGAFSSGKFD